MDYKQFLYVGWLICAMYISYYHGILSVFTSNKPMDNQLFVSDVWLDLILRSLFRLAVPAYMLYNMFYPPPRPDVELQNLHRDQKIRNCSNTSIKMLKTNLSILLNFYAWGHCFLQFSVIVQRLSKIYRNIFHESSLFSYKQNTNEREIEKSNKIHNQEKVTCKMDQKSTRISLR